MDRYLVEIKQEITNFVTVDADSAQEAQKRAVCGIGEFGDPSASDVEVVAVRQLEPMDWV